MQIISLHLEEGGDVHPWWQGRVAPFAGLLFGGQALLAQDLLYHIGPFISGPAIVSC